jgi:ribonuclease P protein component
MPAESRRREGESVNRRYSLKKNREFQYVYRRGKAKGSKTMLLLFIPPHAGITAAGFCVSKKVGNSVTRNLIKRRMREAFRLEIDKIVPGCRLVFIARPSLAGVSFAEIQKTMRYLLQKSGLYREEA